MKRKILFVDDEPNVLSGLQRMLRSMRQEWDMEFAGSGSEALEAFKAGNFDVVVTDMRMPKMDGTKLLEEIAGLYPETVRIVLSGQSDQEITMRTVGIAHQYLNKPCNAEILKNVLDRALALRQILTSDTLMPIVSQINTLPSLPSVYKELHEELRSEYTSLKKIAQIISKDVGMTAKILQMVNSAFFAMTSKVTSAEQAIGILGLDIVKSLVLSVHIFSNMEKSVVKKFKIRDFEKHSLAVGALSKKIVQIEKGDQNAVSEAFMAGLLHDVGKLIMAINLPQFYGQALDLAVERNISEWEAERELLQTSHSEIGAYLLGLWGLPDSIVEAVAFHHDPSRCLSQSFNALTAVHVSDVLAFEFSELKNCESAGEIDMKYLDNLGLIDHLEIWKESCLTYKEVEKSES